MDHHKRAAKGEFDGEVAVGDGVDRVLANAVESQFAGDEAAVERIRQPAQRAGAERRDIEPRAAIGEPRHIAREHRVVSHQVVAERYGLRDLQMGEAGHRGGGVFFRLR